jgi:serine/threonine-protein kinase
MEKLRLLQKIGEGGMSTVWKAWDKVNNRTVAVKVLKPDFAKRADEVRNFRTEERIMEEMKHPGIVQAYEFAKDHDEWYYVMEYVDGYSFGEFLRQKMHVREVDCLLLCESVASALDYAWNEHGLVHCDLKPENLMINQEGVIKVMDLGIAHQFEFRADGEREVPEHVTGTPAYISPELVYGDLEPDCRSDIYSMGATLYHLATGRMLFNNMDPVETMRAHCDEHMQSPDPRNFRMELSEGFAQLLEAMLVKNREGRIQTWPDVIEMCRDVEAGIRFKPRNSPDASSIKLDFVES